MKRLWLLLLVVNLLAACGRPPETPEPLAPTAVAVGTTATETAAPSSTPTATSSPVPTATPVPTPSPTPAWSYNTPGKHTVQVTSANRERAFLLHVPPGYQPGTNLPLVLNLHGLSSSAVEQARISGLSEVADREDFIVVYPQGRGAPAAWYTGSGLRAAEDVVYLRDLIDFLLARMSIDPGRIYAAGYSNGGGMANRLGCALSDRLAAIASVSGAYLQYGSCHSGRPLPVLAFHGTADAIVPYEGNAILPAVHTWAEAWAARNDCNAAPAVEDLKGGITVETWSGCRAGATVVLYTAGGGGHTWPGSGLARLQAPNAPPLPATEIIWDFFEGQQP